MIIMKRILIAVFMLPLFAMAQTKPKAKAKLPVKTTTAARPAATTPGEGFVITGEIKGLEDGTPVSLLNGQSGAVEAETTVSKEKFTLKGKLASPDFKLVMFYKQPPYTTIF